MNQIQLELIIGLEIIYLVQICTNSKKGTGTKIPEILRNFEDLKDKNLKIQLCAHLWPHDSWSGTLDHLAISLVDHRFKKLGKIIISFQFKILTRHFKRLSFVVTLMCIHTLWEGLKDVKKFVLHITYEYWQNFWAFLEHVNFKCQRYIFVPRSH